MLRWNWLALGSGSDPVIWVVALRTGPRIAEGLDYIVNISDFEGKQGNFKVKRGDTQNLPYDFDSIMHYGE